MNKSYRINFLLALFNFCIVILAIIALHQFKTRIFVFIMSIIASIINIFLRIKNKKKLLEISNE